MDKTKQTGSVANNDCLGCKIVSGVGIILIGGYIYTQARKRKHIEQFSMKAISLGALYLGIARLLNIYPFPNSNK